MKNEILNVSLGVLIGLVISFLVLIVWIASDQETLRLFNKMMEKSTSVKEIVSEEGMSVFLEDGNNLRYPLLKGETVLILFKDKKGESYKPVIIGKDDRVVVHLGTVLDKTNGGDVYSLSRYKPYFPNYEYGESEVFIGVLPLRYKGKVKLYSVLFLSSWKEIRHRKPME